MSTMLDHPMAGAAPDPGRLIARAVRADGHAERELADAAADLSLDPATRLDDRTRAAVDALHLALVGIVADSIVGHARNGLQARGADAPFVAFDDDATTLYHRIAGSGALGDAGFLTETLARARQRLIADALIPIAPTDGDGASPLARLSDRSDRSIAAGAVALMAADARQRAPVATDLPAELHHRLAWWVAAAIRDGIGDTADAPLLDRVLADAAQRTIAAHDEGDRPEAIAMRLAAALDSGAEELPGLIVEALADRRLGLAIALAAHAIGIDFALAREIVLDPAADRLALALRGFAMSGREIARILLALAEADPRRDERRVADQAAAAAAVSPAAARDAIAPLTLHPDYRAARRTIRRGHG